MTPRIRDQATRLILAALLNSSLTRKELERLFEEISYDPHFFDEVRQVTLAMLDTLEHRGSLADPLVPTDSSNQALQSRLIQAVNKAKVTRNRLASMMTAVAPHFQARAVPKGDTKRLIRAFLSVASLDECMRLEKLIVPSSEEDPYLKGILDRR